MDGQRRQTRRPRRFWYFLGAAVAAAGIILTAWGTAPFVRWLTKPSQCILAPGAGQFVLNEPGTYMICYEYRSVIDGRSISTPATALEMEVRLTDVATGREVAVRPAAHGFHYESGPRAGMAIWEYTAERPGTYELHASYPEAAETTRQIVLSADRQFNMKVMLAFGASLMAGIVMTIGGMAVVAVTLILRIVNKSKSAPAASGQAPPPAR